MFDINVLADMYLKREPFALASSRAVSLAAGRNVGGLVCSHALTTLYYLLRREYGHARAVYFVGEIMSVMEVAVQPAHVFNAARAYHSRDFEDAVTAATAHFHGCALVVTRDRDGFDGTPVPTIEPAALWARHN